MIEVMYTGFGKTFSQGLYENQNDETWRAALYYLAVIAAMQMKNQTKRLSKGWQVDKYLSCFLTITSRKTFYDV